MRSEILDSDGENRALRTFLSIYADSNDAMMVGAMARHMESLGWDNHPKWIDENPHSNLTKAGAQLWIRHLLSLEQKSAINTIASSGNYFPGEIMANPTFEYLEKRVVEWASARKIIPNATPVAQLLKAVSEMGELADGENKGNIAEIKDAVGDVLVCLINYCALRQISIVECLSGAYDEIKDRKGTLLPNGVFVKEE